MSCPSSLALLIVTLAYVSPEYSPISLAKLTVINGLDTSETFRSPGTTIGFFITVSSWNCTAPVGSPAAPIATPPLAILLAASNPAASTLFTPSPAADPVNVVPSTTIDHSFVSTACADPNVTPFIVTVGAAVRASTVVILMVKRRFVIAVSVDTVSLGSSLSPGIVSLSSEGNPVISETAPGIIVINRGEVGISSNVSHTVSSISVTIVAVVAAFPSMKKRYALISEALIGSVHFTRTLFSTFPMVFSAVASYASPRTTSTISGRDVSTVYA